MRRYMAMSGGGMARSNVLTAALPIGRASASQSSFVIFVASFSVALLNYVFTNTMAWLLPVAAYGVLGLAQSWILIAAALLNAGFSGELARLISRGISLVESYRAAKSAMVGILAVALVYSCILLGATIFTSLNFGSHSAIVVGLILIEVLLLAIVALWSGVLRGILSFRTIGFGQFIEALVKVVAGIMLVAFGFGAEGAVGATVVGTMVYLVLAGWRMRHFTFWREPAWGDWGIYRNSLTMFVGLCAMTIMSNIDIIGLKLFSPPQQADLATGYYQAAVVLSRIPVFLATPASIALFPYISRASSQDVPLFVNRAIKYIVLLITPLNLILIAIPEAVIVLIFPDAYANGAAALRIAALGSMVFCFLPILVATLQSRGLARIPALWISVAAVIELLVLGLLVPTSTTVGAALAFLVASVVGCVALSWAFVKHYKTPFRFGDVVKYLVAAALFVGMLVLLPHGNELWTLLSVIVALLAYVLLLPIIGLIRPTDVAILAGALPFGSSAWSAALWNGCSRFVERLNRLFSIFKHS
jgi:O-antigen/teichoic acid export membrane protein